LVTAIEYHWPVILWHDQAFGGLGDGYDHRCPIETSELSDEHIYEPIFVQQLFDEMSATYGLVNLFSSFGFCRRWRRQCIDQIDIPVGSAVVDLMTGMGELCPGIAKQIGSHGKVVAVDNSAAMCEKARKYQDGSLTCAVDVLEQNALSSNIPDNSADVVISSFGLKTFSTDQIQMLANEIARILRPNGSFSFIEISVPPSLWLRTPYLFYLNGLIPIIGRLFMGNPENYRMLGVYTVAFDNCRSAKVAFRNAGLDTEMRSFFLGCATGLVGSKPGR
jgi:ubiquinone/menaquinone biosynthesis methyltransferase